MVLAVVLVEGRDAPAAHDAAGRRIEVRLDQGREASHADLAVEGAELIGEVVDDAGRSGRMDTSHIKEGARGADGGDGRALAGRADRGGCRACGGATHAGPAR